MMLGFFSCAYGLLVYLLQRNLSSSLLPILKLGYLLLLIFRSSLYNLHTNKSSSFLRDDIQTIILSKNIWHPKLRYTHIHTKKCKIPFFPCFSKEISSLLALTKQKVHTRSKGCAKHTVTGQSQANYGIFM